MATLADYDAYDVISDYAERERVSRLDRRMKELDSAPRKMAAYASISRQEGIPEKTLQRLYKNWKKGGLLALVDKRKLAHATPGSRFYSDFKTYAERDLNSDRGGYNAMLAAFRSGETFSFGTWRTVWQEEFPFEPVPSVCPINWIPRGFTYRRMNQLHNDDPNRKMSLAWSRQGQFAALATTLPVIRSRVGLPVGAVFQADDVWHNVDVFAPDQQGTFQPLEFAIYDVASAYKVVSAIKPRIKVMGKDGREVRDNLKEIQFRFAMQYLVCCRGFHKGGATFVLERGTTAIRENVQRRIAAVPVYGDLLKFEASGVLNTPAFAGVALGNAGGNPRRKSLCECAHRIIQDASASLPGNHGRDAAHMHESAANIKAYAEKEIELARKIDPTLIPYLQLSILPFDKYLAYFQTIQDAVMDRTDHDLEGWVGREIVEYRLSRSSDVWLPFDSINDLSPDEATATIAVINQDRDNLLRQRRMSRREVWNAGQKDLIKFPLFDLPAFADPRDARTAKVRLDGTIEFTDAVYYPNQKKHYLAEVVDRNGLHRRLVPGTVVRFYWNPIGELSNHIWIADESDNVVGMCPILKTATWADPNSIKAALGQKMHQISETMGEVRARHLPDTVRALMARKFNEFLLESAKQAQVAPIVSSDGTKISADDILALVNDSEARAAAVETGVSTGVDFLRDLN